MNDIDEFKTQVFKVLAFKTRAFKSPAFKTSVPEDILRSMPLSSKAVSTFCAPDQLLEYIEGMQQRQESALGEFYEATLPKVYGLALKITRRHDLAEDVVGDTYWQVWQEVARFDSKRGPVMAWLMMMCRSRALDALRRLDDAESHADPATLVTETESSASPLDQLLALERDSALYLAVQKLNATQRQLIALAFFKGYSHEEIAAHTRMALGTVKSHIKRAQASLKAALTPEQESP